MRTITEIILGVLLLACGGLIYLLFRSKSLNIYIWCSALGLADSIDVMRHTVHDWNVPDFVRFSLPDGLYCTSYIFVMDGIWKKEAGMVKCIVMSIVPIVAIGSEILQYFGIVKGTFDVYDLVCYSTPIITYCIIRIFKHKKTT